MSKPILIIDSDEETSERKEGKEVIEIFSSPIVVKQRVSNNYRVNVRNASFNPIEIQEPEPVGHTGHTERAAVPTIHTENPPVPTRRENNNILDNLFSSEACSSPAGAEIVALSSDIHSGYPTDEIVNSSHQEVYGMGGLNGGLADDLRDELSGGGSSGLGGLNGGLADDLRDGASGQSNANDQFDSDSDYDDSILDLLKPSKFIGKDLEAAKRPLQDTEKVLKDSTKANISTKPARKKPKPSTTTIDEKAKEKEHKKLFKALNKANRTKDELLSEMIINLPQLFIESVEDLLDELKPITIKPVASGTTTNEEEELISVSWSRRTNSVYDPNERIFKPAEFKVIDETGLNCLVFNARNFIKLVTTADFKQLLSRFKSINSNNLIIMIYNYDSEIKALRNRHNKEYVASVRQLMAATSTSGTTATNSTPTNYTEHIDLIESIISNFKVNNIKIFKTKNIHETMLFLKSFTYTIASARYDKYERNPDLSHIGRTIKSGTDKIDTYKKILQQFKYLTPNSSNKIQQYIPSLKKLIYYSQLGRLPLDENGKKIVNSNVEKSIIQLFTTANEDDLINE